jgi:hypothetical protein
MDSDQRKAEVLLASGGSIDVQESLEEIGDLIAASSDSDPPFIRLTDRQGRTHMVNPRQILEYRDAQGYGSTNRFT